MLITSPARRSASVSIARFAAVMSRRHHHAWRPHAV